jgi:signal transduction histidine kinase
MSTRPSAAPLSSTEAERLQVLRSYGILDTPIEAAFDDITRIASFVCQTPVALVSLVDNDRQWFKSALGFAKRQTPLNQSICGHALLEQNFLEIADTLKDPRTVDNPLVTDEPKLRFYAGALLRTPDGFPLGTVCVLDDKPRELTEDQRDILKALARQVMSQMELRRALTISDRLQRNVSRLMAVAGHDLKQPLQVMIMAIDRVRSKLTDTRDQDRLMHAIKAGMRIAEELDQLAEMSALQNDNGVPQPVAFPIADIFRSVVSNWQMHADAKHVDLKVIASSARVVSDSTMLRSIIGNLVGNAIKYTERGRVLIGCRRRGNDLSIEILDTGKGIAADQQGAVFDAFHQISPSSEGLGLGLSIVRRTAEALGHRIELSSEIGRGTHVRIIVPLAPSA